MVQDTGHNRRLEWLFLGVYAVLLALVTSRYSMGLDEMRAWLIARDSNSLAALFHYLRYEAHPALWYLILYIPAHISWNPISMQVINYLFAVAEAWLILSARKLHWLFRLLVIFSFYGFYRYGVFPRNYMLATLLLTAAVRCFLGERQHRILGILCLVLAINVHFFAIPIVIVLALQMLCISKVTSWKDLKDLFWDRECQATSVLLIVSVLVAYFTMRPPADVQWPYPEEHRSPMYYYLSAGSYAWQGLIPPFYISDRVSSLNILLHRTAVGAGLSATLFLLVAAALRSIQARAVFLLAAALVVVAMGGTIHRPQEQHLGLIFAVFILALLIDAYAEPGKISGQWLSQRSAFMVLLAVLALGSLGAVGASVYEWSFPYSYAKTMGTWFKEAGLDKNPLVLMPDEHAFLGYMQRASAYYPACRCECSFLVQRVGGESYRMVTEEELESLSHSSRSPVIVLTKKELPTETLRNLHLTELRDFPPISITSGSVYVYQRRDR